MIYIMISLQEMKLVTLGFSLDKLEDFKIHFKYL